MKEKPNLNKFNIKKQSLISRSKNERGAGRKCIGDTKRRIAVTVYLTEKEAKELNKYIKEKDLKGHSFCVRSFLAEKGILS